MPKEMPGTEPVHFFALKACCEICGIGQAIILLLLFKLLLYLWVWSGGTHRVGEA